LLELRQGDPARAVAAFERALRYERPYPAASLGLATALIELDQGAAARRELELLIAEANQPAAVKQARALLATVQP
jgi:thioredoxin-like negative regulator of GroEL